MLNAFIVFRKLIKNWHNIGTVLLFPRKSISVILCTVKILQCSRFPSQEAAVFIRKVVVLTLLKRIWKKAFSHVKTPTMKKLLENDSGEANYFSTVVFIFITVLLLAFIIDLFGIISTKQQLDHCADQMVKQIQLSGGVNGETDALFQFLCGQISGASNISYTIDASYRSPTPAGMNRAIQLGNPFYITITGDARLGGFWNFNLVNIRIVSRGAGVSEHYWK